MSGTNPRHSRPKADAPKPTDPLAGQLVVDVRRFINKLFPAALTALNDIMQLTPLESGARLHRGLGEAIARQPTVEVQLHHRASPAHAVWNQRTGLPEGLAHTLIRRTNCPHAQR